MIEGFENGQLMRKNTYAGIVAGQNVIGISFERLTIIKELPSKESFIKNGKNKGGKRFNRMMLCKCDCGNTRITSIYMLKSGQTVSCGCLRVERHTAHGLTGKIPEYTAWQLMKRRCDTPTCKQYNDYGGRGIKVCERWLHSFENFLEDMGRRPTKYHSLDKYPDNNGNYEKSNCRWATRKEQNSNKRNNILFNYNGEIITAAELSRRIGLKENTIYARIRKGWDKEKIMNTPLINH